MTRLSQQALAAMQADPGAELPEDRDGSGEVLDGLAEYVTRVLAELKGLSAKHRARVLQACLDLNRAVRFN